MSTSHLAMRPQSTNLEDLEVEWRARSTPGARFAWDGIVCPDKFMEARLRVLFVLREPSHERDAEKATDNDLRAWLLQRGKPKEPFGATWKPVARWAQAILGEADLKLALRRIAAVNIRKEAGGKRTDRARLTTAIQRDRHFFSRQVELINPQVIIGAGTGDELIWLFDLDPTRFTQQPRLRSLDDGSRQWLLTQHPNRSPYDLATDLADALSPRLR